MKKEITYICDDGSRYITEEEAMKYEALCSEIKEVMNILNPRVFKGPKEIEFIQQDLTNVKSSFSNFMNVCAKLFPNYSDTFIECGNGKRNKSQAEYLIYNENYKILSVTMARFNCISFISGKEYMQPAFVINEEN